MEYLKVQNLNKSFGELKVLDDVSFSVNRGEFVSILGASGSGKTTLLRIIAGLESPDSGSVLLDGNDITNLPPEKRNINMVFQSYALFEHMTVAENVGYSLKLMKLPKREREDLVNDMLSLVGLEGRGSHMPSMLSGGQRQRVAIARAIINQPKMLLLDEPLGALDHNLGLKMQEELKDLQRRLGITFLYITHNRDESLFLSDKIGVLSEGRFVQFDTKENILASDIKYVNDFMGLSKKNE